MVLFDARGVYALSPFSALDSRPQFFMFDSYYPSPKMFDLVVHLLRMTGTKWSPCFHEIGRCCNTDFAVEKLTTQALPGVLNKIPLGVVGPLQLEVPCVFFWYLTTAESFGVFWLA